MYLAAREMTPLYPFAQRLKIARSQNRRSATIEGPLRQTAEPMLAQRKYIEDYLGVLETQRRSIFAEIEGLSTERLGRRPPSDKWSIGEHFEHLLKAMRLFRRTFRVLIPLGLPVARLFKEKPYTTTVSDVHQERPRKAPFLILPKLRKDPKDYVLLSNLKQDLEQERIRLKQLFDDVDDDLAGHIKIWDGPLGWVNLLQELRTLIYHEEHHFNAIRRLL
jgi:hypothetical protein